MIRLPGRTPLEEETQEQPLYREMLVRVQNADIERKKHEKQWSDNPKLVLGDHSQVFDTGSHKYFVVNRVRQVVDTHTAVMTENPPIWSYEPHEVGEPPDWLLKPEAMQKVQFAAELVAEQGGQLPLSDEQVQGEDFIDDPTAQMLLGITYEVQQEVPTGESDEQGQPTTMTMSQQVPVFERDDFYVIDNQLEADLLTQEIQCQWRTLINGNAIATEHIFEAQVIGHCDMLPQWNDENQHFTLTNLYPYNVWIDPWAQNTADAEYYIIRELKPVSEAKALWPEHAEFIEHNATMPGADASGFGVALNQRVQNAGMRKVIPVWTWWQRNHPFERTPEDAIERGLVQPAVDVEQSEAVDPDTGQMLLDPETEMPLMEQHEVDSVDPETGQQLFELADGTRVQPGDELWPKRYGIRQVQFLKDMMVFDEETEFVDIPAARTKCMMIPKTPYGQGEPQRMGELNDLYNHLYSIYHGYFKHFRSPQQVIPEDVYNATKDAVERMNSDAALKWIVPKHLVTQYGANVVMNLDPPQLGTVISEMMNRIDQEMDKISGMSDVMRGETKSDQSGELYRQALEAARGPVGLKARNFGDALTHVGRIVAHLVIDFMDPQVWAERNTKYPALVFQRIQERLRRHGVTVSAEVSGAGTREQRVNHLQELWSMGVQTQSVLKDLLDQMGHADSQKIVDEWQQMMTAQQEVQQ